MTTKMNKTSKKYITSYTTKDGEIKFMYRLHLGKDEITGKSINTTGRGFDSIPEALEAREVKKARFEARKNKKKPFKFADLAALWLADYKQTVEPSTFDKTVSLFNNHILPVMGNYDFEDITPLNCQQFIRNFSTRLTHFHKLTNYASLALGHAVILGYLSMNPFDNLKTANKKGIKHPVRSNTKQKAASKLRQYFMPNEIKVFLDYLKEKSSFKVFIFFRLLVFSGCRKGEALALRWEDIDFSNNTVSFNKAISSCKEIGLFEKGTKNNEIRCITLDNDTMNLLNEWKTKQKEILKISNIRFSSKNQLVFQNKENRYIYPTKTTQWLEKAKKELAFAKKVRFTAHVLRHTHATICAMNNVQSIYIMHRLGHSDLKTTTNYYVHSTDASDIKTCNAFAEAVS